MPWILLAAVVAANLAAIAVGSLRYWRRREEHEPY